MAQTPQQAAQAVADGSGYVASPLTPEQLAIQKLGSKTDNAPVPQNNPPDPQVPTPAPDYNAGLAGVDTSPKPVSNPPDPQNGSGETVANPVPASDVKTSATSTNFGTTVQTFDDGSTIQTFDDGSTLATGTDGRVSSSPSNDGQASSQGAIVGQVYQTQDQPQISNLQFAANTDWRVTLRLAPGATYLYNDPQAGLLAPLKVTNGVVFPYTPAISTAYKANYSSYDLTHSNYRGYFYQNSYTDAVNLTATFTAQSTSDAAYVLAVIHFFRSVTKMFYGQDAKRGSPPPLVFLSGLGDYQFNNHPCVVSQFNYTLPADVDYVSSGAPNNLGLNLQPLQNLYSTTLNAVAPTVTRLANAFLPPGAQNALPSPLQSLLSNPSYVPSKMDIVITLLPVQSRQQVSQQFSLKNFANGQLIKGGFW